jgi:hypothetical protein
MEAGNKTKGEELVAANMKQAEFEAANRKQAEDEAHIRKQVELCSCKQEMGRGRSSH